MTPDGSVLIPLSLSYELLNCVELKKNVCANYAQLRLWDFLNWFHLNPIFDVNEQTRCMIQNENVNPSLHDCQRFRNVLLINREAYNLVAIICRPEAARDIIKRNA